MNKTLLQIIRGKTYSYIRNNIINHPYNYQLFQGQLPKQKFEFYLIQDKLFIYQQFLTLNKIAALLPNTMDVDAIKQTANYIRTVEKKLLQSYLPKASNSSIFNQTIQYMATSNYINHISNINTNNPAILLARILPCFISYKLTYAYMKFNNTQNMQNPYSKWILSYNSPEFQQHTNSACEIFNNITTTINDVNLHQEIYNNYLQSLIYEKELFDSAYYLGNEELIIIYRNYRQYLAQHDPYNPTLYSKQIENDDEIYNNKL